MPSNIESRDGVLAGRVAVISGSTRGAGREIAKRFAGAGANVVLNGRTEEKGRAALEELAVGERASFVAADVTARAGCEQLIAHAIERWGRVDVLINNAGGTAQAATVADLSDEGLALALNWTLWSTFWCTQLVLPGMISRRFGRIINISSLDGKEGLRPINSAYITAKHAVHGLTKSCAVENGEFGITVNAICPGMMLTDIVIEVGTKIAAEQGMTLEQFLDQRGSQAATGRITEVEDVATIALLLASDAGSGISGSFLSVDGGSAPY